MLAALIMSFALGLSAGPADREISALVERSFLRAGRPAPTRDLALDRAARAVADAEDSELRAKVRAEGVSEGLVLPVVARGDATHEVLAQLERYVAAGVVPQGVTHYGLASGPEGAHLIFVRRVLTLDPKGTSFAPEGGLLRIEGELRADYSRPEGFLGLPDQRVLPFPVSHRGRRLSASVALEPGLVPEVIEIVAKGPRGREVVLLAESGQAKRPASVPANVRADQRAPWLVATINRERRRLGLRELVTDPRLMRSASSHAAAMAKAQVAAHQLPGGADTRTRLARAGVTTWRYHENVAAAGTLAQAHAEIWASPSHRLALIDPDVGRIGVGVVAVKTAGGPVLYVVEHLVAED